ncbi:hypothetical protein EVJ58_g4491 [Rhodofomes roseus]|uniref:Acyl-CoA thioesterase-like C-terminal domain-containing protein n=1 Tax=Rhodofomes roseus TaxID=34475 RepID=A0A4Y9YJ41_9APHY|nr:hypothetical protein EVJ58_g4491 [Rhodofomes roseus]
MPPSVPSPEECEDVQEHYERMLLRKDLHPRLKAYAEEYIQERRKSPMEVKTAGITNSSDGATVYMWWFKVRSIPKYDAPFQKTSLDHTMWFYDNSFDCGDWILYVVESPRAGNGRGVVHGRIYTRTGTLIAVASQEGVVRARGENAARDESRVIKAKI